MNEGTLVIFAALPDGCGYSGRSGLSYPRMAFRPVITAARNRIRRSPSVAASLLTELNPFLVNVTGQSGYELNGLSSGASNV